MQDSILFPILLQVILISLNAIFACAEIAIVSMNDNRLALLVSRGDKRALRLARLTSRPARFLATIQIAITLSGFMGSAFAADNFSGRVVSLLVGAGVPIPEDTLNTISVVLITLILSYFTLVFGELVPKRIGMKKAESLALALSGLVTAISRIFAPVVAVLTGSTNLILRLMGIDPNVDEEIISEEEIKMMVDKGSEKGVFDRSTRDFIDNVFAFDDLTVGEFVTHRTQLDLLWVNQTTEEWARIILATRHTRYPVCADRIDNVVGILDARDFFPMQDRPLEEIVSSLVKPPFFVPETVKADVLFREMKERRSFYSVVLDERGGFLGIATMHDLLEQLVGDIGLSHDFDGIRKLDDNAWRIRGSVPLEQVAHVLGIKLPLEEYETFGGYVFGLYGSVPQDGKHYTLETDRLRVHMDNIQNHRLEDATVTLLP